MMDSLKRFSSQVKRIGRIRSGERKKMNAFQNLRNKEPVPKPLLAEWGGVVDYAHQPWARRLPGVLLAALFLTGLLLWMGLPSWFLH